MFISYLDNLHTSYVTTKSNCFMFSELIFRFTTYLWKWETLLILFLSTKHTFLILVSRSCEFALILHSFLFFLLWSTICSWKINQNLGLLWPLNTSNHGDLWFLITLVFREWYRYRPYPQSPVFRMGYFSSEL